MSQTITLDVGGMTCDGCAMNVTKAINSLEEVSNVEVSHETGKATVSYDSPNDEKIRTIPNLLSPVLAFMSAEPE